MILKQFQYLVALAREQHFGRAAASCSVSQPTLSTAIRHLEDELGVPLVMRGQRFVGLTAEGQRTLEWAERILADEDAMRQELSELRGALHGRLRLGVVPTALPVVATLTAPFLKRHPEVTVTVRSRSSTEIQHALDNFEIELGLTYLDNEPVLHAKSFPLYVEQYCLLTPKGGRFAGRESVTWAEAAAEPLCLLSRDMQNRRIIDDAFAEAGTTPEPQIETNSITNLGLHVQTGNWSSIVPQHFLHTLGLPPATEAYPLLAPDVRHQVGIVCADREPVPPTAKAMLAVLLDSGVGKSQPKSNNS